MSRFPIPDRTPADPLLNLLGERINAASRGWVGPYKALALLPALGLAVSDLVAAAKNSNLTSAEAEVAILTVARELNCEYGWHAHVPLALASGVGRVALQNLGSGATPHFSDPGLDQVWSITSALNRGKAGSALEDAAETDPERSVALVALSGIYRLIFQLVELDQLRKEPSEIQFAPAEQRPSHV